MQPKLFKTTLSEFVPAVWSGKNESGWHPTGDRVLVLPDKAAEMTSGSVHLPPDVVARHSMAAETGVVVAIGDGAFKWNSDKMTPFEGRKPNVGDRVYMERYSGQLAHGHDKEVYRLMESACIGAVKTEDK